MKNINYRRTLCIGLLSLNVLSSCTNTKQAMNSREQMEVFIPGKKIKTHNTNWKKRTFFGTALLAASTLGGMAYMSTPSPSDITTGLNNTNFAPANIHIYNGPQSEMLIADMPNTTGYNLYNLSTTDSLNITRLNSYKKETSLRYAEMLNMKSGPHETTQLMNSVVNNNINEIRRLLQIEVSMDIKDKYGRTALMHAAINNITDAAKLLIENNANMDLEDNHGKIALEHALEHNSTGVAKLLIKKQKEKSRKSCFDICESVFSSVV